MSEPKFKKGDKVRIIGSSYGDGRVYKDGEKYIGNVVSIMNIEIEAHVNQPPLYKYYVSETGPFQYERDLELVEEPKTYTYNDFEVGDELCSKSDYKFIKTGAYYKIKQFVITDTVIMFIWNDTNSDYEPLYDYEIDWNKSWERKQEKLMTQSNVTVKLTHADGSDPSEEDPLYLYTHDEDLIIKHIKQTNKFNYKTMNLREKIKFALTGEPLKTLIKNDVRNQDGTLTHQGEEMFMDFLKEKFGAEFDELTIANIKAIKTEEDKEKK